MVKLPIYLIKLNARMSLRKNYWKAVFSAFLIYASVFAFSMFQRRFVTISIRSIVDSIFHLTSLSGLLEVFRMSGAYLFSFAPVILLNITILKPLSLIGYNFFVDNSFENDEKLYLRDFLKEVLSHYPVYLKTMLLRTLVLLGWTCLGVVPVFFKAYSYRMVPYILAKDPDMKPMDVLRESEKVMKGFRLKCLWLDLSFMGWYLLSALTVFGVYMLFVGPYYYAVYAEVYDALYIDDQLYSLKYADHPYYHPTVTATRQRNLTVGACGALIYIAADLLLYWGSNGGTNIGLMVMENWQYIRVMHFAYSIILACVATPMLYKGISAIIDIGKEMLGGRFDEHGHLSKYFEYSAILYTITVLLCHVLYCLFPALFKILIMQMEIREAAIIVNHLALYVIVPMELACNIPIAIISAVYIYMVLIGRMKISRLAVICAPAVNYFIAEYLSGLITSSHLQDVLDCSESFGWLLFVLVFLYYNGRKNRAEQKEKTPLPA